MQDFKVGGETVSGCSAGCAGGVMGAFLGGVLAIGIVYSCSALVGESVGALGPAVWMTGFLMLVGGLAGAHGGANFARNPKATPSSVPPNVEEAARTYFTPSTPPPIPGDGLDKRIKQPEETSPDPQDTPGLTP